MYSYPPLLGLKWRQSTEISSKGVLVVIKSIGTLSGILGHFCLTHSHWQMTAFSFILHKKPIKPFSSQIYGLVCANMHHVIMQVFHHSQLQCTGENQLFLWYCLPIVSSCQVWACSIHVPVCVSLVPFVYLLGHLVSILFSLGLSHHIWEHLPFELLELFLEW